MLRTRVITAVCLLVALLLAVFFLPLRGWSVFVALIAGLAAWEFARLARFSSLGSSVFGASIAIVCAGLALTSDSLLATDGVSPAGWGLLAVSAAFWLFLAPFWLYRRWPLSSKLAAIPLGIAVIVPTWLALVFLWRQGPATLIGALALVWVADIAAYFAGRRFGRRKLAPAISPGKTWEGAWGAMLAVTAYGLAIAAGGILPLPAWALVAALPVLTLISIEGDLFESLLKRQAGFKDSSNLLPGHGGILDRIDSLTSTLPVVALLMAF